MNTAIKNILKNENIQLMQNVQYKANPKKHLNVKKIIKNFFKINGNINTEKFNYTNPDVEILLRDLNLKYVLNEIDITPNPSKLNYFIRRKCKKLSKKGMIIGGSVLLKACGILDRKPNDIDVFWNINKAIEENIINKKNIINSSDYNDLLENEIIVKEKTRYKVKLDIFTKLDIFNYKNSDKLYIEIDGIKFKNPLDTLKHKFEYYRDKDKIDFLYIKNKFNI